MSDEEFITYVNKFIPEESEAIKQIDGMFEKAAKSKKKMMFYRGAFMPTEYVREHNQMTAEAYLEILKRYKGRILALTGTADLQADHTKLALLRDLPNATLFAPEGVNHMLRKVQGDNSMLDVKNQYKKQFKSKQPLDATTVEFMKNWIDATLPVRFDAKTTTEKTVAPSKAKAVQTEVKEKE